MNRINHLCEIVIEAGGRTPFDIDILEARQCMTKILKGNVALVSAVYQHNAGVWGVFLMDVWLLDLDAYGFFTEPSPWVQHCHMSIYTAFCRSRQV
jgi:hypothetical protein